MPEKDLFTYYDAIFSKIGLTENGGITRPLFSDPWMHAQKTLKREMEAIGMTAHFDSAGNLFGALPGSLPDAKVIATGSHIDTVVDGGRLDGQYGILAGLVAIQNLQEKRGQPQHTLLLISVAEEEGSRFPYVFWGSKNIFNLIDESEYKEIAALEDEDGCTFGAEMARHGFSFQPAEYMLPQIDSFIELHIEQGNFLEMQNKSIGIITAITGQKRYEVTIKGQANHAGTTLMGYRRDAIHAYAKIVSSSIDLALEEGDPLVLTFGNINVVPNVVNVVPGEVTFSIDCRHPDGHTLNSFTTKLEKHMKRIVDDLRMEIEINKWMDAPPVPMDFDLTTRIREAVMQTDVEYAVMHSGAGHDSQIFAPRVPTGMIFVPSIGGISHNPAEDTKIDDLHLGIRVLENVLGSLAYE